MKPAGGVQVLKILGREYNLHASPEEEATLQQAASLLQEKISESQQRFPNASNQELLVLTALNLCVPALQQKQQEARLHAAENRLFSCLKSIAQQLNSSKVGR